MIRAGRNFVADKSENGNGTRTTDPIESVTMPPLPLALTNPLIN